ncbi:MAG: hypothetical protein EU539_08880 [Promethearchaeota archaeon]|nr:MAG: hypothetical protein EU539_08880 [Candidatus Lokiarchaeota archaeon]
MEATNIRVFKLNYSGSFDELGSENLLDLFSLTDVLAIYVPMQKRMYIWIGSYATQGLKKHIAQIRALFSTQLSELKILRNITMEAGSEPSDFFQFMGFTWEELNSQLKQQKEELSPIFSKIKSLEEQQTELIDSEGYQDAIKIAEKIIALAKEIKNDSLIIEQEDLITELIKKAEIKTDVDMVKKNTLDVKKKFDNLIITNNPNDVIEAHHLVEDFKNEYKDKFDLKLIPEAVELFNEDDRIWSTFAKEREYSIRELENLSKKIKFHIEKIQLSDAEALLNRAKELLLNVIDEDIKDEWNEIDKNLIELKLKHETIGKVEKSLKEAEFLKNNYQFKEALNKLNSTMELIQDKEIVEYNKKLQALKETLLEEEQRFLNLKEEIDLLDKKLEENRKKNQLKAALINCEKILKNARLLDDHELVLTYTEIFDDLKNKLDALEAKSHEERDKLIAQADELKKVVKIEDDVLPLMEDFSIEDLIDNLSDDLDEVLEQIGELLETHRVEIKHEISNKTILKSTSGEALELEKEVQIERLEEEEDVTIYGVQSGLTNPFEDAIEEAILTDLIPYNYEITEIQLNGENPKELPDKSLTKNGIEYEWSIQNIPPKGEVNIDYNLRRRISRTVILMLKDQLKIIKNHSNLNSLDLEGLYEARLPFTNSFGDTIHGVVIEDIIPLYYLHFIKEPQNLLPAEVSNSKSGDLIKWNVGTVESKTIDYQYRLLELYRMEEIKITVDTLSRNGLNAINKGDLTVALEIYDKIISQLEQYNK